MTVHDEHRRGTGKDPPLDAGRPHGGSVGPDLSSPSHVVSVPAAETTVLDPRAIAGLRELEAKGGPGCLDDLVDTYLHDAEARLQQLRVAIHAGDQPTVAALAHSLKGSSGSLAAAGLSRLCSDLQMAATNGDQTAVADHFALVGAEFTRVSIALRAAFPGAGLTVPAQDSAGNEKIPLAGGARLAESDGTALDQAVAQGARKGWTTAVVALHLDHTAGGASDAVAPGAGQGLGPERRAVVRLDGDGFFVVCEDARADRAAAVAARLSDAMASPIDVEGHAIAVTGRHSGGRDPDVVWDAAVVVGELKSEASPRRAPVAGQMAVLGAADTGMALREACDDGELRLVYQPMVAVATGRVTGVEALLRWDRPGRGTVLPNDFIPAAEASGMIVPIGAWVLEEACRQAKAWAMLFPHRPAVPVSVNVSARQFDADVVGAVARALNGADLGPGLLCLELTETTVMRDVDAAVATLQAIKALGVSVSIDDFGTGYSSLAYLRRLPLDEIKVDKSFVDGLGHDPEDTAIVAAVVAMAHALDLAVVAEGVETKEQFDALRTLGCESAQGYYFARPLPPQALHEILAAEAEASWAGHQAERLATTEPASTYRTPLVVVADDDADVLQLAYLSLTTAGFEVRAARTGRAAIALVEQLRPDCVILDLMMPDMNGLEVCGALREDPASADCTIVMLTASSSPHSKIAAFSVGADDYIVKPFSPRDLVSRVRAAINRAPSDPVRVS